MATYTKEQLALIKTLVEVEKCTVTQITAITGVPRGSVSMLASRERAKLIRPQKPNASYLAKVTETRKIATLKDKYARVLREHFGIEPAL